MRAASASARPVVSSEVPSGMSSTTCSSDLLSKGSSFTVTVLVANMAQAARVARPTPMRNRQALRRVAITRPAMRR